MKVKELINQLQELNQDMEVMLFDEIGVLQPVKLSIQKVNRSMKNRYKRYYPEPLTVNKVALIE